MRWFDEYLNTVAEQIRVQRIRRPLMVELKDHLYLQKDAYLGEGLSESEAEHRAIADMGDPLLVGGELDRAHCPRTQWTGILLALFFMALGLVFQCFFDSDGLIGVRYFAFSALAAGILLLVSVTDYTLWMHLTFPVLAFWLILWIKRFTDIVFGHFLLTMASSSPALYALDTCINRLLSTLTPECICVAAPLLTAFIACRMRGRQWGAFALCTALPTLTAMLAGAYWQTGYNSSAMLLIALCSFGVMLFCVKRGFFRIRRAIGLAILGALCILPLLAFVHSLTGYLSGEASEYVYERYRLLAASRALGQGAGTEALDAFIQTYPSVPEGLLVIIIHRFGWIPFLASMIALVGLFGWLLIHFVRMKNRMGAQLGFSAVLTLAVQLAVYYLFSFTAYPHLLCLPLMSYGNAMLVIDSILTGTILSVLRCERLPEPCPTLSCQSATR